MNRIKHSFQVLISLCLMLTIYACKKTDKPLPAKLSDSGILKNVQSFLQKEMQESAISRLDLTNAVIYRLMDNCTAIRIPLQGLDQAKYFVLVASNDNCNWFGNYVSLVNTDSVAYSRYAIRTTSFDSTRVEINYGSASRSMAMAAPVINLGVPGTLWLNFTASLQQQFLTNSSNWYYPDSVTNPVNTGGNGNSGAIYYDPYIADNIILDRKLRDSFPCIVKLLDTISSQGNLVQRAQVALNEIFNVGKKIHLTLRVEESWTKDSLDGTTMVDSAWTTTLPNGSEGLDFYAKISLNKWLLKNATKEYIASTIIHEAFHAYIDYKYLQYRKGIIDSNAFKTLFPLYWPPRYIAGSGIYISPTNSVQHQAMAANLIQALSAPIWGLTNNNMSNVLKDSLYKALSWGGLGATTAWRMNSDTCKIMAINRVARDTSYGQGHSNGPFMIGNCTPIYTFSSSSLNFKMPCQ